MKQILNEHKKGQQDDEDGEAGAVDVLHGVVHEVRAAADATDLAPRRGGDVAQKGEEEMRVGSFLALSAFLED